MGHYYSEMFTQDTFFSNIVNDEKELERIAKHLVKCGVEFDSINKYLIKLTKNWSKDYPNPEYSIDWANINQKNNPYIKGKTRDKYFSYLLTKEGLLGSFSVNPEIFNNFDIKFNIFYVDEDK